MLNLHRIGLAIVVTAFQCLIIQLQVTVPTWLQRHLPLSHNTSLSQLFFLLLKPVRICALNTVTTFPHTSLDRWTTTQVHCRPTPRSSNGICPIPILQMFFPDGLTEGIVLTQGLNGENLRFPLHLWYSPTALQRSSPVNRSIYNITCGSASKAWCGPVVVLKFNGSRRQGYTDASPNDLPALSAYFLAYKWTPVLLPAHVRRSFPSFMSVSCPSL